jgi:hypothetical protein
VAGGVPAERGVHVVVGIHALKGLCREKYLRNLGGDHEIHRVGF